MKAGADAAARNEQPECIVAAAVAAAQEDVVMAARRSAALSDLAVAAAVGGLATGQGLGPFFPPPLTPIIRLVFPELSDAPLSPALPRPHADISALLGQLPHTHRFHIWVNETAVAADVFGVCGEAAHVLSVLSWNTASLLHCNMKKVWSSPCLFHTFHTLSGSENRVTGP